MRRAFWGVAAAAVVTIGCRPESLPRMPSPTAGEPVHRGRAAPVELRIQPYDPTLNSAVKTPGKLTVNFVNRTSKAIVVSVHPYFLKLSYVDDSNEFLARATRRVEPERLHKLPPEMIVVVPPGNAIAREVAIPLEAPTDYEVVRLIARLDPVERRHLDAFARKLADGYHATYPRWKNGIWSNRTPAISARIEP